ncbi:hypothetical protein BU23DRAFT_647684, partial [Bimuria novae-zelandiae CBS 107.79]
PDFYSAINTGAHSDLRITCGNQTWHVHKAIVCSASSFLQAAVRFPVGKEAQDNHVDFPEDDPDMIRRMIVFMYAADYDPTGHFYCKDLQCVKLACGDDDGAVKVAPYPPHLNIPSHSYSCACHVPTKQDPDPSAASWDVWGTELYGPMHYCLDPLSTHATMFSVGEKYGVGGLCDLATEKFKSCLGQHHLGTEDFVDAVGIVHNTTMAHKRALRDLVAECFKKWYYCDLDKYPEIEANLPEFNKLSMVFLEALRDAKIAAALFDE